MTHITLDTDGSAKGNPGPGGYGVVLLHDQARKELSQGYRLTTNNRMELMAVIAGLEALKFPCRVTVYSDSTYVVNAVEKGWLRKWSKRKWMRTLKEPVVNPDLWKRLLELLDQHEVNFIWIRGHGNNRENVRCDALAVAASEGEELLVDEYYEANPTNGNNVKKAVHG